MLLFPTDESHAHTVTQASFEFPFERLVTSLLSLAVRALSALLLLAVGGSAEVTSLLGTVLALGGAVLLLLAVTSGGTLLVSSAVSSSVSTLSSLLVSSSVCERGEG